MESILTYSIKSKALLLEHIFITMITDSFKKPDIRTASRIEIKFLRFVITVK